MKMYIIQTKNLKEPVYFQDIEWRENMPPYVQETDHWYKAFIFSNKDEAYDLITAIEENLFESCEVNEIVIKSGRLALRYE